MSIYIGNDLEDRLKILETENASLKRYNEYHQVVHEIDHMSDLHVYTRRLRIVSQTKSYYHGFFKYGAISKSHPCLGRFPLGRFFHAE